MNAVIKTGQLLFGIAVTAFGVEIFAFHNSLSGFMPLPEALNQPPWIYVLGILLMTCGISIIFSFRQKQMSLALAVLLFLLCLWLHVPGVVANIANGGKWTVIFEMIALAAGALLVAANPQSVNDAGNNRSTNINRTLYNTGRFLFALSLLVFGILHFVYGEYIATLIPVWMPAHLFWAYFIGVGFTATAISLFFSFFVPFSASLLAVMFFLWVIVLHAPRTFAAPHIEPEWTSLFIALAMGAIALQFAGVRQKSVSDIAFINS